MGIPVLHDIRRRGDHGGGYDRISRRARREIPLKPRTPVRFRPLSRTIGTALVSNPLATPPARCARAWRFLERWMGRASVLVLARRPRRDFHLSREASIAGPTV